MENKTGKYLKYAIGEIVLVVIGILIALSINNWNENIINLRQEKNILESLKREFNENQNLLSKEILNQTNCLELLKILNGYIEPNPKLYSNKIFDSLMFGLVWLPSYTPKDGVINSIITTGKISLIKNLELNSKLSSWNSLLNEYNKTTHWIERDVFELVVPYINNKFPVKRTLEYFDPELKENSKFQYSQNELLSDFQFESLVSERIIDANDILYQSKNLYTFQSEVLLLIEHELNQ